MADKAKMLDNLFKGLLQLPAPKHNRVMPTKGDRERKFVLRMDKSGNPKMIEIIE